MRILSILFIFLALSACTSQPSQPIPTTPYTTGGISNSLTAIVDPLVEQVTSLAVKDLSARLSLDPSMVTVLFTESVVWTDTALGCPLPGEVHAQQAVPGYRLRLEANGQEYDFHTDADSTVILCPEEDLPSFPVTPGEIDDGEPWMPVD